MADDEVLLEGRPSMAAALGVAAVGFAFFGAATALILLLPWPLKTHHVILAGITGSFAGIMFPWQLLDARSRRHQLTGRSVIYYSGVLSRSEIEVPFSSIRAVAVRQGILQRMFRCGDVRISAQGVAGGRRVLVSSADMDNITIKSIPDYREVSDHLRANL